jgi:hypothetical protein
MGQVSANRTRRSCPHSSVIRQAVLEISQISDSKLDNNTLYLKAVAVVFGLPRAGGPDRKRVLMTELGMTLTCCRKMFSHTL